MLYLFGKSGAHQPGSHAREVSTGDFFLQVFMTRSMASSCDTSETCVKEMRGTRAMCAVSRHRRRSTTRIIWSSRGARTREAVVWRTKRHDTGDTTCHTTQSRNCSRPAIAAPLRRGTVRLKSTSEHGRCRCCSACVVTQSGKN